MADRKTITIDADVHADLEELKRDGESWSDLLTRLADDTGGARGEHSPNTLTEAHIDDIANAAARRTLEELETARR
jgi:hypothetical protein